MKTHRNVGWLVAVVAIHCALVVVAFHTNSDSNSFHLNVMYTQDRPGSMGINCTLTSPLFVPPTGGGDESANTKYNKTLDDVFPLSFFSPSSAVGSYARLPYGDFYSNFNFTMILNEAVSVSVPLDHATNVNGTTMHQLTQRSRLHIPTTIPTVHSWRYVLTWTVDLSSSMATLSSMGQLVASSHVYEHHALVMGYSAYVVPLGFEDASIRLHVSPYVDHNTKRQWTIQTPLQEKAMTADSFFTVLDSPLILIDPLALRSFPILPNQTLWTLSYLKDQQDNATLPFQQLLQKSVKDASLSLLVQNLWDEVIPFHVIWELVKPQAQSGWAMEHNSCFQAMDNATAHYKKDIWVIYQAMHHMTHARFIPRRMYPASLQPMRQVKGAMSEFVFFSEGWAQYLAFTILAQGGQVEPLDGDSAQKRIILDLSSRFGSPYFNMLGYANSLNLSLAEVSKRQYTSNQELWFFNFGMGAFVALLADCQNNGQLLPALIKLRELQSTIAPDGYPDNELPAMMEKYGGLQNVTNVFSDFVYRKNGWVDVPQLLWQCLGVQATKSGEGGEPGFTFVPNGDPSLTPEAVMVRKNVFSTKK